MKNCCIRLITLLYFMAHYGLCYAVPSDNNAICTILSTSPIVSSIPMRDHLISHGKKAEFDNPVYLITLEAGIRAVFKPCFDEEDLADYYAEVVAYKASEFMGFGFVPPTVIRIIDGHVGSLQLFIETNIDTLDSKAYSQAHKHINTEDLANLKIFYFVFGQWDTGPHNLLISSAGNSLKLIAIDNSGICNRQYVRYGELPFVRVWYSEKFETNDEGTSFPFEAVQHIQKATENDLFVMFKECIPQSLCRRLSRHNDIYYVIYNNSLWIQFHRGSADFEKSYTTHYPPSTIKKLEQLTMKILKETIFEDAADSRLFNNAILNSILERRDQILAHYYSSQAAPQIDTTRNY